MSTNSDSDKPGPSKPNEDKKDDSSSSFSSSEYSSSSSIISDCPSVDSAADNSNPPTNEAVKEQPEEKKTEEEKVVVSEATDKTDDSTTEDEADDESSTATDSSSSSSFNKEKKKKKIVSEYSATSSDGDSDLDEEKGRGYKLKPVLHFTPSLCRFPEKFPVAKVDHNGDIKKESVRVEMIVDVLPEKRSNVSSDLPDNLDPLITPIHTKRMVPMLPQYPLVMKHSWAHPLLRTTEELDAASDALDELVLSRGSLMFFRRSRTGSRYMFPLFLGLVALISIVISLCNRAGVSEDGDVIWRIGTIFLSVCYSLPIAILQTSFISFIFPGITRTPKRRTITILCFMMPYAVGYVIQWAFFGSAKEWWFEKRGMVQFGTALVGQAGLFTFFMLPEWARVLWHKDKRERYHYDFIPSCWYQFRTQSGMAHTLYILEVAVLIIGNILSYLDIIAPFIIRLVVIVLILPLLIILLIEKRNENMNTWSGGFGTLFGMAGQISMYAFCQALIPVEYMLGGGFGIQLAGLIGYIILFGLLFYSMQEFIHSATEDYHAPQYLFLGQGSFHAFVCGFVCMKIDPVQFWPMAVIHWVISFLSGSGIIPFLTNFVRQCMCGKSAFLDKEKQILRYHYNFLLNVQGRLADMVGSMCFPLMMLFDVIFDPTDCSISCGLSSEDIVTVILHFLVYIIVDVILFLLCFLVYSIRFSKMTHCLSTSEVTGAPPVPVPNPVKEPLKFEQIVKTWRLLWHAFELHLNRYMCLFVCGMVCVLSYVTYNILYYITPNPRWASSSSSLSSSSSSSDSVFSSSLP